MDISLRKKKAQQARTQVTISIALRFALTVGAVIAAITAAISAFAGLHAVDRVASVTVVILLVIEAVAYGLGHVQELLKTKSSYSHVIHEIEDNQYKPSTELLPMPRSFPHNESVAFWVNSLRWKPKPQPLFADLAVAIYVLVYLLVVAIIVVGVGVGVEAALQYFHLIHE